MTDWSGINPRCLSIKHLMLPNPTHWAVEIGIQTVLTFDLASLKLHDS